MAECNQSLIASTEALPKSDERKTVVDSLNEMCREIIDLANDLRKSDARLFDSKRAGNIDEIVNAATEHGRLQERLYSKMDEVERTRRYAARRNINVYVVHTATGLPIRVDEKNRKNIWDC